MAQKTHDFVSWRPRAPVMVFVWIFGGIALSHWSPSILPFTNALEQGKDVAKDGDKDENVMKWRDEGDQNNVRDDDTVEDSLFDPIQADPDCQADKDGGDASCWSPPASTLDDDGVPPMDASCSFGGDDPDQELACQEEQMATDQHWGSDPHILRMRHQLRTSGVHGLTESNRRPPIFLMPGLASTRLVAWRHKTCPHHPLLTDIKPLDNVWLNMNLIIQMGTIDVRCMQECMSLGINQTDTDNVKIGCKLRPDEGLDAISSLSPGGLSSNLFVGGTNTVYAWLIQWLSDHLGYDVSSMFGFPYDWRLSPDKMEQRDGFLTLTRRRIEAAVQFNGEPGIMVAHSMGNLIFRYFLLWLRKQMRQEAYDALVEQTNRRIEVVKQRGEAKTSSVPGWLGSRMAIIDEFIANLKGEVQEDKNFLEKLGQMARDEGDVNWRLWIDKHIWTYVGLSGPMLGAVNPLRSVISGENMGIPITDPQARVMELSFGSTHTVNPISSASAFCDEWKFSEWDEEAQQVTRSEYDPELACLDDIANEISETEGGWDNFPALKSLLWERKDWDSDRPMIEVIIEDCEHKERTPCKNRTSMSLGPKDAETGELFTKLNDIWREKGSPLIVKREQLRNSFWKTDLVNVLNTTWHRPPIKHVIMAYGVDIPTEVAYVYRKTNRPTKKKKDHAKPEEEYDGVPNLERVYWETAGGGLSEENIDTNRGGLKDLMKKPKRIPVGKTGLVHGGDGSVPYLSLSYVHTWLLHSLRARKHESNQELGAQKILDSIDISHRPEGGTDWRPGFARGSRETKEGAGKDFKDTGTDHPHGTRYKPEMLRYHTIGTSRMTGRNYSTTVIEAIGVEHKETTRNYDILAACFTDVLRRMHDDFDYFND